MNIHTIQIEKTSLKKLEATNIPYELDDSLNIKITF